MKMVKYYARCIRWLWRNSNWKNSRQKWKAMEREVQQLMRPCEVSGEKRIFIGGWTSRRLFVHQ